MRIVRRMSGFVIVRWPDRVRFSLRVAFRIARSSGIFTILLVGISRFIIIVIADNAGDVGVTTRSLVKTLVIRIITIVTI